MKLRAVMALLAVTTVAGLSGCANQVALTEAPIPDPLFDKLPVSVAVRLPKNFSGYVHEEQVLGREKWTIDLGDANDKLFTKLFAAMFEQTQIIDMDTDPEDLNVDALIEPRIEAFEFSVPLQSKTPAYAVWIRYRLKVFDAGGEQVADWPVSAYGKSQSTTMGGKAALRRAAVLAMRDAAALIGSRMDKATGIGSINQRPEPALEQPAETPASSEESLADAAATVDMDVAGPPDASAPETPPESLPESVGQYRQQNHSHENSVESHDHAMRAMAIPFSEDIPNDSI